MWLKHYYPLEFWTASLTCVKNSLDQIRNFIATVNVENPEIEILPPSINKSNMNFKIEKGNIRYGLESMNGLGVSANIIVSERRQNGHYKSVQDFVDRLQGSKVNKRTINALLFTNAFSEFGDINVVYKELIALKKDVDAPQVDEAFMAIQEANLIGANITFTHPILARSGYYLPMNELIEGVSDTVAMRIIKITKKTTKTGKPYNLVKVTCLNSGLSCNIFDWGNRQDLGGQDYLIGRVTKKNNFITLNGPSSAPGKNFTKSIKNQIRGMNI